MVCRIQKWQLSSVFRRVPSSCSLTEHVVGFMMCYVPIFGAFQADFFSGHVVDIDAALPVGTVVSVILSATTV